MADNHPLHDEHTDPLNVAIRAGIVEFMEAPEIIGGVIRFGKKRYRIDEQHHPVEVKECGCDVGSSDSGDCACRGPKTFVLPAPQYTVQTYCTECMDGRVMLVTNDIAGQAVGVACSECNATYTLKWDFSESGQVSRCCP